MSDSQLYLAIGIPVLANGLMLTFLMVYINHRHNDLEKLLTEKLLRVEQVLDARLKHLEEK